MSERMKLGPRTKSSGTGASTGVMVMTVFGSAPDKICRDRREKDIDDKERRWNFSRETGPTAWKSRVLPELGVPSNRILLLLRLELLFAEIKKQAESD